ncbi:MAG TPA: hypothetical protein PLC25_04160 [Bacilli bacterium]|nr:hypothetical protein [Bacilli bacterium]
MSKKTTAQQIIYDVTRTFWQLLRVSKIGDVYPNINYEKNKNELILKWYMEKIKNLCNMIYSNYPIKQLSVGIFFKGKSSSEELWPFCFTTSCSPDYTFSQVIIDQHFDIPLTFKIVDNNNKISFYQTSFVMSCYEDIDILSYLISLCPNNTKLELFNESVRSEFISFKEKLMNSLNKKFMNTWQLIDFDVNFDKTCLTIVNNALNTLQFNIAIDTIFSIKDVQNMLNRYNNQENVVNIMKSWIKLKATSEQPYLFSGELNKCDRLADKFFLLAESMEYIYSDYDLWYPICKKMIDIMMTYYEKHKWFLDIVAWLKEDSNATFNDFMVKFRYYDNTQEELQYYDIYNR